MSQRVPPIARIRLARSPLRLQAVPLLFVALGVAVVVYGLVATAAPLSWLLAAAGAVPILVGLAWAVWVLSIRLEVEEAAVGVSWLGGGRVYPLSPGPVTRVRLRGDNASRLRARTGWLGWAIGPATLRGDERIEVVRLAPTTTAILVPTERGRLAIAAADEEQLLAALSRAARARQRLEALADRMPPPAPPVPEAATEQEPDDGTSPVDEPAHELTGIERALLEQRLAEERAAAEAAAATQDAQLTPSDVEPSTTLPAARGEAGTAAAPTVPAAPRRRRLPRVARPRLPQRLRRRPRPAAAFVVLPTLGAGVAWGIGIALGTFPPAGSDLARLTSLALVLAGPATSVGALMALAVWPRLVGVVVAGGLAASVFIGRALVGG